MASENETAERRKLIAYGVFLTAFVAIGLLIGYELLSDLELIVIAILIAVILRSGVLVVDRIGAPAWMAPIITLTAIGALIAFLWLVLIPGFLYQAQLFTSMVPGYLDQLSDLSSQLPGSVAGYIPNVSQSLADRLRSTILPVLSSIPQFLASLTDVTVRAIIAVILALYMAHNPSSLVSGLLGLVPYSKRNDAIELIKNFEIRLRGWVVGTGLAMLIVGLGAGIGLWIIGVPLAPSFGFLAGLLEIIPYFGPFAGALLPILVAITISPSKALLTVGLFVLLHLLDANLIQPQILGRHVRLHPAVVLASFLFLGDLLGFIGVILAVPVTAFLASVVEVFILKSPAYREK